MKAITIDKLKPFVLQDETHKEAYKCLLNIHTADKFAIASNSYIVAIIYNDEKDHDLNYTFGNSMDIIVSAIKSHHRESENDIHYKIIFNRKDVLDTIANQFKLLKQQIKEQHKITIKNSDAITKFYIDCQQFKLYIMTYNVNLYNKQAEKIVNTREFIITEQSEIGVDFIQPNKYKATQLETWFSAYNTKYILDYLKFMDNCEHITLITGGSSVQPIRSEEQDREILLLPVRC